MLKADILTIIWSLHIFSCFSFSGSFSDDFRSLRSQQLWAIHHDYITCTESQCVYLDKLNVKRHKPNPLGILSLNFKNDCYGIHCQTTVEQSLGRFTPFSSGKITSSYKYGYGSFRFRSLAVQDTSYDVGPLPEVISIAEEVEVMSCFILVNDKTSSTPLKISLCISSKDPLTAITSVQAGSYFSTEYTPLLFDASKHIRVYGIDYHPCHIKFIAAGNVLRKIKGTEVDIPYEGLRIGMVMLALSAKPPKYLALEDRTHIHMRMLVYRASYMPQTMTMHDEPLMKQSSYYIHPLYFIGVILFIFILCFYVLNWNDCVSFQKPEDFYMLMKDNGVG